MTNNDKVSDLQYMFNTLLIIHYSIDVLLYIIVTSVP